MREGPAAVVVRGLLLAAMAAAGAGAALGGCKCGGAGGPGSNCDQNDDCDPGLYCDPISLTCQTVDSGPPGTESGMATDTGAATDSGNRDSATGLDAGADAGGGGDAGRDGGSDAAPPCFDYDLDGVTDCAGDCNDADPNTYPGAPEVCGDGVTNDCLSTMPPDTGCMGIGTYVAPPPLGDDANPGTQASPVATINEGIVHAMMIGGGVDVYVAADVAGPGVYAEDITMEDGISLWGGHESAGWTRSPAVNVTVIDDQTTTGVFFPVGITTATTLDGFTINGVPPAIFSAATAAAITVATFASPVISGNIVNAPDTGAASYGIQINAAGGTNLATPLVTGNVVNLGLSASGWFGGAWGIRVDDTPALIIGNTINLADDPTYQRGIEAAPASAGGGLAISYNVVRGAAGGSSDISLGIRLASGGGTIDSNDVDPGTCSTTCVGVEIAGSGLVVTVTNNVVFGGIATTGTFLAAPTTVAMRISFEGVPAVLPDVLIHSNYFNGEGSGATAGGTLPVSVGLGLGEHPAMPIIVGRVYDNAISSGVGAVRYAVAEGDANIDPEIFDSNALWAETMPAAVTSGLYLDEAVTTLTTAAAVDALGTGINNIEDDCSLVSPVVGGDFHLLPGSMCIDAGNAAELPPFDYEGDPRPAGLGPDIGVDET